MPAAARMGDPVIGMTTGEHSGHTTPHLPMEFRGMVNQGSPDVFINGIPAARQGDQTLERDNCCGFSYGSVKIGSGSVLINGRPAARQGDPLNAHNGEGSIAGGSGDVIIGG